MIRILVVDVQALFRPGLVALFTAAPEARCDVEGMSYCYSFDPDLEQEWT